MATRWTQILGSVVACEFLRCKVTRGDEVRGRTRCFFQESKRSPAKDFSGGGIPELLSFATLRTASVFVAERSLPLDQLKEEDVVFVGSAFCFRRGSFMTCAHLFQGPPRHGLLLRLGGGRWAEAQLLGASVASDVAVLKLCDEEALGPAPFGFSQKGVQQGERVVVCGMTQHGREAVGLSGLVSQPRQCFRGLPDDPTTHFVQLALPTLPGMSGSPVLNAEGQVCAMVAKKFEEHGLAIPSERLLPVAECLEAGYPWRLPVLGMEVKAGGTLTNPSVLVKALPKTGSAAKAAGVEVGDEILSINGISVGSILEMREALLSLGDTRSRDAGGSGAPAAFGRCRVRLRLRRDRKVVDLEVDAPRAPAGAQDVSVLQLEPS